MRILLGVMIGLVLGFAVSVSAQYMYPGLYDGKTLVAMHPAYAQMYVHGVVDALIARNWHLERGGGAGAAHLDKSFQCLWTNRLWMSPNFMGRLRMLWAEEPNRNGALRMIDQACRLAGKW